MNDTSSVRNINIQDILVSTVNKSKWTLILSIVYISSSKELHRVKLFACETDTIIVIEGKLFTDLQQLIVCTVIIPVDMMSTISVSVDSNFEPQSTLVWFSLPQSNSAKKNPICLCQPQFARRITF